MALGAEQQRWRQTEELFYQASELPPEERESFVELHCAGDDELLREVWSLLASADEPLEPLSAPIRDAIEDLSGAPPGMVIGPYRILRLLGEGGMGKVYLATRADQQYQQQVAIKFMHAGQMAPRSLLLRFRSERQILADLNHPNIARMFDGGVTAEGVPYIVMEYVDGTPIHVHCREHHSTVAERLRLFLEVCAAVDYAHRHLVVHRDLKPANILVTAEGVPKLLDFGIAKLLEDGQDSEGASTRTLDRLLTPEYASPEQVEGKPVTTVTDVYGLGALLYELLAGRKPFRLDNIHSLEAARVICETLPELPGTAARDNPGAAPPDAHLVKGDLDRVAMMALRKEPERRYASALTLAADLEAWLAGYPVQARPATWSYVTARYVRRHRWAVGAAAVALLALIGFSAGMTLLKQRADRQQIIAAQQAEFLSGMFHAATPDVARGKQLTVREMLDLGAQRAEQQTGDSEVRASLLLSIGWSYRWLGYYEQALRLAKQSYAIQSRIYGESGEQSADSLDLLAGSYRDAEDYAHAEPLFRRLLDVRQKSSTPDSLPLENALSNLGECLYWENKDTESEALLRRALAIDQRKSSEYGVGVRNYLALVIERRSAYAEASQLLHQAVDLERKLEGTDNSSYALSLHNLSGAQIDAGDLTGAEATLREVLVIRRKLLGNDHPDLAYTLNNLSYVLIDKGDFQSAVPFATEARALCTRHLGPRHHRTGTAIANLARALAGLGRYRESEDLLDQVMTLFRETDGPQSPAVSQILHYQAQILLDQKKYAEAESLLRQELANRQKISAASPAMASAMIELAEARVFQHDVRSAEPLLRQALEIRKGIYPLTHPAVIAAEVRLGEVLWLSGAYDEAHALLENALHTATAAPYPMFAWQVAEAQSALGACLKSQGRALEAARLLGESRIALAADPHPLMRIPADRRFNP